MWLLLISVFLIVLSFVVIFNFESIILFLIIKLKVIRSFFYDKQLIVEDRKVDIDFVDKYVFNNAIGLQFSKLTLPSGRVLEPFKGKLYKVKIDGVYLENK